MIATRTLADMQLKRIERWSAPDRIPFWNSQQAVNEDIRHFRAYMRKDISLPTLCRYVEKANYLPAGYVSEALMLNELKVIGWL